MERSSTQMESKMNEIRNRLKGVDYPLDRDTAEEKLRGIKVGGKDITEYFDQVNWPINSESDLDNRFSRLKERM